MRQPTLNLGCTFTGERILSTLYIGDNTLIVLAAIIIVIIIIIIMIIPVLVGATGKMSKPFR
jgi:hypothetical protein